ncbi:MAG TPA: hypothetical protein ENK24_02440 [Anaerolineae bacterium]|nr:hypothetical protein [Anaerolineae bacterium]
MQDKILSLIEQHPFLTPLQISLSLDELEDDVADHLKKMSKKGLAGSISSRYAELEGQRLYYALEAKGNRSAAPLKALAYRQLAAAVGVYEVRNFLFSLNQNGEDLRWWDAFWWESYKSKKDQKRQKSLLVHGGGVWQELTFIVEWDRGDLPVTGLARRARALASWLGAEKFRIYYGFTPAMVIVATTWNRASAFFDAFAMQMNKKQAALPPVYATTRSALRKRGWKAPVWAALKSGETGAQLFQGLLPIPSTLWPGDLNDRRRSIFLPHLPEALADKTAYSYRQAALVFRTTPAAKLLLKRLAVHPLATENLLRIVTGLSYPVIKQSTRDLKKLGLLKMVSLEGDAYKPRYAHITRAGLEFLAAGAGVKGPDYIQDRGYRLDELNKEPKLGVLGKSPDHLWHTRRVFISFYEAAGRALEVGWDESLVAWDDEIDARRYFTFDNERRNLAPDGYGIYRVGHLWYKFFVEVELTESKSKAAIVRKVKSYRDFLASGEINRDFAVNETLYLLLIGKRWSQIERWRLAVKKVLGQQRQLLIRLTTFPQLERTGITGLSWRDIDMNWTHPFPALKKRPESARVETFLDGLELHRQVIAGEK